MQDPYQYATAHIQNPITNAFSISPSNTTDLPVTTRSVYIGSSGDLRVTLKDMPDGTFVTYKNMIEGLSYPLRIKRVFSSGTTASNLIGEY